MLNHEFDVDMTSPSTVDVDDLRAQTVGIQHRVPLLDGSEVTYVNLDNAASTPPLVHVRQKVDGVMEIYSSVHRGAGFKSLLSTYLYDKAREILAAFVGADHEHEAVIFVKNTSEAINKLAHRMPFAPGDVVITSLMEHHSDDLPWRAQAEVVHAGVGPEGRLDLDDLRRKLAQYSGRVRLVALTGASNVTGFINPIYDIAELAHKYGARIMVDAAQLLPHRSIDMGAPDSPRHLDFLAMSGHKVYAPFGTGALIGPKAFFNQGEPEYRGGGTIDLVSLEEVIWTGAPERDEAGSPNVIGAVALAASLSVLRQVGMDRIAEHEAELTRYALRALAGIDGVRLYGSADPDRVDERVGVIPFGIEGVHHAKAAAILGFEGGIGVRNGCFCAHPYVLRLMDVSPQDYHMHRDQVIQQDRSHLPGFMRASFGCYSNFEDIDRLVMMVAKIVRGEYIGDYVAHKPSGSYYPAGFELEQMAAYFSF